MPSPTTQGDSPQPLPNMEQQIALLRDHFGVVAAVEGLVITLHRSEVDRARNYSVQKLLLDTIQILGNHYQIQYREEQPAATLPPLTPFLHKES
ncbi:MAG: hypothetical protein J0M12_04510 [Deltaproteobacteria bacterium]|nr:hypothetical protein [Deltaproteobacteria bacterium]